MFYLERGGAGALFIKGGQAQKKGGQAGSDLEHSQWLLCLLFTLDTRQCLFVDLNSTYTCVSQMPLPHTRVLAVEFAL